MPLIAIAPCSKQHDYEEAVRRAGGEVRILDYETDSPEAVVSTVDGILLPGGDDVQPSLYGAETHPAFEAAEPGRDAYEIELTQRAAAVNMPLFAICRGIQVLNVYRNGTLRQDIGMAHQAIGDEVILRPARIDPSSQLAAISGIAPVVNHRHHQVVDKLGEGLRATAWSDGYIEAMEAKRHAG